MTSSITLLTLPPHLIQEIDRLVEADLRDLPGEIKSPLKTALADVADYQARNRSIVLQSIPSIEEGESGVQDEETPPTIDVDLLEFLARWADSKKGRQALKKAKLDPNRYLLISLLAGTEVWIPPKQRELLSATEQNPDKPNPYLPAHLSAISTPQPSPLKSLNKQMTTILNILFSIFGSGFAVFVASVTGAGYSREKGVILGILAGVVVGIAEGVLFWIFVERLKEGREGEGRKRVEGSRGSGGVVEVGIVQAMVEGQDGRVDESGLEERLAVEEEEEGGAGGTVAKKTVRLRRRALGMGDAATAESI